MAEYLSLGADHPRDGHVAARRRPRGQAADHRAADVRPLHLPLPVRPRALGLHRRAAGATRPSARSCQGHARRRRRRGGVPAGLGLTPRPALRPVARLRCRRRTCPRSASKQLAAADRQAGPHQGALRRHAAHRAGPLARRQADRLLQRARTSSSSTCYLADGEDRRGHHDSSLKSMFDAATTRPSGSSTPPASWSPDGKYLAFAARRAGRRRHRHPRPEAAQGGPPHPGEADGVTTPGRSAPTASSWRSPGMEGGLSDLYVINADGTGLRQLTRRQVRRPARRPGRPTGTPSRS